MKSNINKFTTYCNIWRFPHVITTVKPAQQVTTLRYDKHSWWHAVNSNNVALGCYCKSSHYVYVPVMLQVKSY
jgi:hypothetical protein